jgi:L-2,4-diaminobutyrate decarboxylase
VHVDAGEAGVALFSDRLRPLLAGIEYADSVALDFPELDGGLLAVRSAESLAQVRPPGNPGVSAAFRAHRHRFARDFEDRCDLAGELADAICERRNLRLWHRPALSTVVFRPARASDASVVQTHGRLVASGSAVDLTTVDGLEWLKLAVTERLEYLPLLDLVGSAVTVGDGSHSD